MTRLKALGPDAHPELEEAFANYRRLLGYVPTSVLIMSRRPKLVQALAQLASAVWDPASEVPLGFKRLVAYTASRTAGCAYSMAHAAEAAHRAGVPLAKIEAAADCRASPLFTEAERVALDFAAAAAAQPNAVSDALFERLKRHWSEAAIVEIVAAVALHGFLNRWNSTLAVPLEAEPAAFAAEHRPALGGRSGEQGPA
jgi:alkylhydroperoxidase family enzyme